MGILDGLFGRTVSRDEWNAIVEETSRISPDVPDIEEEEIEIVEPTEGTEWLAEPHESTSDDSGTLGRAGNMMVSYDYDWRRR